MKKTFSFLEKNKKPERVADSIRNEIKRYISRERRKELPEGATTWHFDCRIGVNEQQALAIKTNEINLKIEEYLKEKIENFYLEILAKPANTKRD
ncbi:MAG: hypothetical protein COW00_14465 [Bdellovibrio sp. CG12_big_fil_rev_8_21_14_0_65_39_13]|nr:MAG: hypothetical protein COW00_14465 [Bdellovibrio sp. CG12_big_fil_rev_8_21_14_0_65_39_13]PJB54066.1 MAG: hypothetical protein CO099_03665 [Bdellovibrio sp. CG_4_9_14_3_um_filter_39_7]